MQRHHDVWSSFWNVTWKIEKNQFGNSTKKMGGRRVVKLVYLLRDNTGVAGVVPKKYVMFRKTTLMLKNTSIRSDVEKHRS
jgi:hypothetical protein